ncbi:MAG: NAD(P)-binding protein [Acidobacteria bacterium]|nr:NAD(P)-binding protein [Acidobacteriota bacterium]
MAQEGPRKIAVLGSGVGSMTAVFALTSRPDWQQEYEITVYQMGWRLGGKGAAGRNAKYGDRIEEHGLHVWLGFYDNAFRMMRQCYEELDRPAQVPIRTWTDAFTPYNTAILAEFVNQRWVPWHMELPTNGKTPGDGHETLSVWDYVEELIQWLLESIVGPNHEAALMRMFESHEGEPAPKDADSLIYVKERRTGNREPETPPHGFVAWLVEHLHGAHRIARDLPREVEAHEPEHHDRIIGLLDRFLGRLKKSVEGLAEHHDATRRLFILADLSIAGVKGIFEEDLLRRGFIAADDTEFRTWLKKYGASDLTISSSPVREVYDLAFAYENGDLESPNIAAGTAMTIMLRMALDYKGSAMYKMTAGMGDTIFAPLYELLKRRGVKFEFFHRVRKLELSDDGRRIARMRVDRQVTLENPTGGYQPFVDVHGLPCWPSEPLYDQIVERDELRKGKINLESSWSGWAPVEERILQAGRDFDQIILGISIAALHSICSDLRDASESWRAMLDNVQTVQTQAVQLWLDPTMAELGWTGSVPMIGTWAEPLRYYG